MAHRRVLLRSVLLLVLIPALAAAGALTAGARPAQGAVAELQGHDISWPQCPKGSGQAIPGTGYGVGYGNPMPPASTDFVIIGLTDGLPFYRNHCLVSQVDFVRANQLRTGVYTMAAYPTADQLTRYGAAGPRPGSALADRLFNAGYAMARFDLDSMRAVGLRVPFVWIDVESRPRAPTPPNWPTDHPVNNRYVLRGLAAGFADAGMATGWYSTRTSWSAITGNWADQAPMWKAGDYDPDLTGYARARSICTTASLNAGPIWAAQAVSGSYDLDVTCPSLPAYDRIFGAPPPATGASVSALTPAVSWATAGSGRLTWQVTLGTTQDWTATVANVCTGTTVRTMSGRAAGRVTISWDGTTASGDPAPVGAYQLRVDSAGQTRTAVAELTATGTRRLAGCAVWRSYHQDRYGTSVIVGRLAAPAPAGTTTRSAVLASGEDAHLVDGVVAAPLAAALDAPLLLTTRDQLPAIVADDLRARGVQEVYVVGGSGAVGTPVRDTLRGMGLRLIGVAGSDRYQTSVAVARRLQTAGGATSRTAWLASGEAGHLVDGLAAGGPAAAGAQPVLLTRATALPGVVADELTRLRITRTYLVGDTGVISAAVAGQVPGPVRLAGADRYATAAAVAGTMPAGSPVLLASGEDAHLVDALPGGATGRPILLTRAGSLPNPSRDRLVAGGPTSVTLLGGPGVISPAVSVAVARLVPATP